ncbi:TPA: arylsulfatase [Pseudomonas putida]|nr:arylsulfatase [Pseudomonas putida]
MSIWKKRLAGVTVLVALAAGTAFAEQGPVPASAVQQPGGTSLTPEGSLPPADFAFKGHVGKTYKESDPPQFPQPVQAPKGAPNVVLIMLDDSGFGQFSTFGGGVPSPTMDRLAAEGLSYNRFHTTALCSPTRAALLTGRNHHMAGFGVITEGATGYDGYTGVLPRSAGTIAQVLQQNGYMTAMIGKNHNTPTWETSAAGPYDRWPSGQGFDYFYGFNGAESDQFHPVLYEDHTALALPSDPNYHLTTDLADHAISWVRNRTSVSPGKPFFMYVAPGATHAPHQAPKEWIDKFKGQFDAGWDAYREATLERQKRLGIVPPDTRLTPRPESLPAWESLAPDQKRLYARMMEVFAGFGAHADYEMGRIVDEVKRLPGGDNTIFVYVAGDNGASAEGGLEGSVNENAYFNSLPETWQNNLKSIDKLGGPELNNHFPASWAHAMNTPFQFTKQVASHFGGTRNPMIITWPGHITDKGKLRSQFIDVTDIVPTLYDLIGIKPPAVLNGIEQKPLNGISFASTFASAKAAETRRTQYFEMLSNRGIYHDGWMASSLAFTPWAASRTGFDPLTTKWELYHVDEDFSQADNVADKYPEKVKELDALFWSEAAQNNVLPLDWRIAERMNAELQGRPSILGKRTKVEYYAGTINVPKDATLSLLNKSWTITADVELPNRNVDGMIMANGGISGGYAFYLRGSKPAFVYNWLGEERATIAAEHPLPPGKVQLKLDFAYDGGGRGKGGTLVITANGDKVAEGRLDKTIPNLLSVGGDRLDIGMDNGTAVDTSYKQPFAFNGKIEKVTIETR